MKKPLFVSSLVLLIAGFGTTPASVSGQRFPTAIVAQIDRDEPMNDPAIEPQLELLDSGSDPKLKLEFIPPAIGAKETVNMMMDMNMALSVGGQAMPAIAIPAMNMTFETEVTQVDANGDIHLDMVCSDADIVATEATPPELSDRLRSQMQKLIGLKSSFIIDSQGNTKAINFEFPNNLDPNLRQLFEQMFNSFSELSPPRLEEPVGKGAQWRISSFVPAATGIAVTQVATYEVVDLQDNFITLNVTTEQQADPQTMSLPGMPPNSTINLTSYQGQGQGQIAIQLGKLMPLRANMSMETNTQMQIEVTEAGTEQKTTMDSTSSIKINLESK